MAPWPLSRVLCTQNVTAATRVVAAAAGDDATVAWVGKLIAAVQSSAGLTGWNIQTLAADPNVQVLILPSFDLPKLYDTSISLTTACVTPVSEICFSIRCICTEHNRFGILRYSKKNGSESKPDGGLQAAVVPVLVSTANVSGLEWAKVDGSALVVAQKTATLQVALL